MRITIRSKSLNLSLLIARFIVILCSEVRLHWQSLSSLGLWEEARGILTQASRSLLRGSAKFSKQALVSDHVVKLTAAEGSAFDGFHLQTSQLLMEWEINVIRGPGSFKLPKHLILKSTPTQTRSQTQMNNQYYREAA